MSFDKATRNALARMVGVVRERLRTDITAQLQSTYRLQPDGSALPLDGLTEDQRAAALDLREQLDHFAKLESGPDKQKRAAAFDRLVREIGFTVVNRLAALRLCEERGLVVECVRQGTASEGFRLFDRLANGALGARYETYRVFLENLFDELALDLGVLFDRHTPLSHVFPSERALEDMLNRLNDPELAHLWTEDETIGWIYQYYNDEAERRKMRDESQAPRNSRELAMRNQFFTPRYVVEFLTDNTLGRIWYEMRQGETRLAEECRYLVRRREKDAETRRQGDGETEEQGAPEQVSVSPSRRVSLPKRPKKDPREILMLDPAGGSGHFGLYCFDLFETIYVEAYDDPELGAKLQAELPDRAEFLRQVPRLILAHNIHIIDIDPRACQIAALALWLRAQRSFQKMGLKPQERPQITKVNVVCAEPMPGERDLLDEFVTELRPRELGELVRFVFDRMQLAGEAGSLLKIEEELRDKIGELRRKVGPLFARGDFWDNAEHKVLQALQEYVERASNGRATRRRLFADDAAQGFAFIDLCLKKYDVVLMNPPFGEFSKPFKTEARYNYPLSYNDILAAFVERFIGFLPRGGLLGAITSRTAFFLSSFSSWRKEIVLKPTTLDLFVDLGPNVMDDAVVEASAYCIQNSTNVYDSIFIRLLGVSDRSAALVSSIDAANRNVDDSRRFMLNQNQFLSIYDSPIVYWVSKSIVQKLSALPLLEPDIADVRVGLRTGDDLRFVRAFWEIPNQSLNTNGNLNAIWVPHVKAGASQPWFSPLTVVVNWQNAGKEIRAYLKDRWNVAPQSTDFYFKPGFSWTRRAVRLVPYAIPRGCIPGVGRYMAFPKPGFDVLALAICASNLASCFLRFYGEKFVWPNFLVGNVRILPWATLSSEVEQKVKEFALKQILQRQQTYTFNEPFQEFTFPPLINRDQIPSQLAFDRMSLLSRELDDEIAHSYGLTGNEIRLLERDLREAISVHSVSDLSDDEEDAAKDFVISDTLDSVYGGVLSYVLGCTFGRWDIRIALDPTLAPKLQDPFDPLPICPPGMLVGLDGLPAAPGSIVREEWLRARPNAITLPPQGSVRQPTIPDSEYPVRIAWDGILVDDPGLDDKAEKPHPNDIVRRVREVLTVLWGDRADAIEAEACEILGGTSLREYFRKPSGFFTDHLKRYSKSRRQAPIYWPLSTASGRYTVWLYYHRLTQDTLFAIVNRYLDPKIESVQKRADQFTERLKDASGRAATELRDQLSDTKEFLSELLDMRAELLRVAALPYKPNLNDGVIVNAAPLHKLFRLRKWANDTVAVWEKLAEGEYGWSHLAYTIWPKRVEKLCETDRSIAIAHGLEHLCKVEAKPTGKKRGKGKKQESVEEEENLEIDLE